MVKLIATVGYPSSGKSIARDIAIDIGYNTVTMGDYVRQKAEEKRPDKIKEAKKEESNITLSEVYGNFATDMREKYGSDIVAEWCINDIENSKYPVFLDGIRTIESYEKFNKNMDTTLLYINAPASLRIDWIKKRGRDQEDEFNISDLIERDQKENSWGVNKLIQKSDVTIHNCTDIDTYKENILTYLESQYES